MDDVKRGFELLDKGNAKRALRCFKKAADNGTEEGYSGMIISYHELDDIKARDELLDKMMKCDSDNPEWHNLNGFFLKDEEKYQQAIKSYNKSINLREDPDIIKALARCHYEMEQYDESLKLLQKAMDLGGDKSTILQDMGDCYTALEQYDVALEQYDEAMKKEHRPEIFACIGVCYNKMEQYENAIKQYRYALDHGFDYPEIYNSIAECYNDMNQYENAIKSYNDAIRAGGGKSEILQDIAYCYENLEQYENAIKSYNDAILEGGDEIEIQHNIGVCYQDLGQYENAIRTYERLLDRGESYTELHCNMTQVFCELNQYKEAINHVKEAFNKEPDLDVLLHNAQKLFESEHYAVAAEIFNNLPSYVHNAGICYVKLQQYEKALECFEKSNIDEKHLSWLKAECWYYLGDYQKSIDYCKTADQNHVGMLCRLGSAYTHFGKYEESLKACRRACDIDPNIENAHNGMYFALRMLNRNKEAKKRRNSIIKQFGNDPEIFFTNVQ